MLVDVVCFVMSRCFPFNSRDLVLICSANTLHNKDILNPTDYIIMQQRHEGFI